MVVCFCNLCVCSEYCASLVNNCDVKCVSEKTDVDFLVLDFFSAFYSNVLHNNCLLDYLDVCFTSLALDHTQKDSWVLLQDIRITGMVYYTTAELLKNHLDFLTKLTRSFYNEQWRCEFITHK